MAHKANCMHNSQVQVQYEFRNDSLFVHFEVQTEKLHLNPDFTTVGFNNNGLWDYDVVEVFIQKKDDSNHYLEIQCSPLSQKFALLVKKPREVTQSIQSLCSKVSASKNALGFSADFEILFNDIPGHGNELRGNFFSCLGPADAREYFALNINQDDQADFHRPDLFQTLGQI